MTFESGDFDRFRNGSPPVTPKRGIPGWLTILVVVIVALAAVAYVTSTDSREGEPRQTAAAPAAVPYLQQSATRHQGACLDGLYPSPETFGSAVREDIATSVAGLGGWPAKPPNYEKIAGRDGLDLWVRAVHTDSLSTSNPEYSAHTVVPAVSGLTREMPALDDPTMKTWTEAYEQVALEQRRANAAASTGRATVNGLSFPPYRETKSGISACLSVMLQLVRRDGPRSFLIATDCNEPIPPQLSGDFHGDPLLVIQTCVSGRVAECDGYYNAFTDRMRSLNAGEIKRYRPEEAGTAISEWIRSGDI